MKTLLNDLTNRPEFERIHLGRYIGSSRISAIAGLNPYYTPLQVWAEMMGKVKGTEESDAMWFGTKFEPHVAERFAQKQNYKIQHVGKIFQSDNLDWAIASPDFLMWDDLNQEGLLEIKTTNARAAQFWENGIPDHAHIQIQWQLGVCDRWNYGVVCALIGGQQLKFHRVERDPGVFGQLLELAKKFLSFVDSGTPPEATAHDSELISSIIGDVGYAETSLSSEYESLFSEYTKAVEERAVQEAEMKRLDERCKGIKNQIRMAVGDAAKCTCGKWQVFQRKVTRKGYEIKPSSWVDVKIKEIAV